MASDKDISGKRDHIRIGQIGESLACRYLLGKGYEVLERNYRKPYGEIDVVARKEGAVHFVEVKTVSCETVYGKVTYGTQKSLDSYDPSDNVHPWKLKRLARTIEAYLLDRYRDDEPKWQLDVLSVYLSDREKKGRVVFIEDIEL